MIGDALHPVGQKHLGLFCNQQTEAHQIDTRAAEQMDREFWAGICVVFGAAALPLGIQGLGLPIWINWLIAAIGTFSLIVGLWLHTSLSKDAITAGEADFNTLNQAARTALFAIYDREVLDDTGLKQAVARQGQKWNEDILAQLRLFTYAHDGKLRVLKERLKIVKRLRKKHP
jgi:hypothetical protein